MREGFSSPDATAAGQPRKSQIQSAKSQRFWRGLWSRNSERNDLWDLHAALVAVAGATGITKSRRADPLGVGFEI